MSLPCHICNKKNIALRCSTCQQASCKQCSYFIDEDAFEMVSLLPEDLKNQTFCSDCYQQTTSEKLDFYKKIFEQAKEVDIYTKDQSKETRLIKRTELPLKVENCNDREEALMQLAFMAAEKGYSILVDLEIKYKKVGPGKSYKKLVWDGVGTPVDPNLKK